MPINYAFKKQGKPVPLSQVDGLIWEEAGFGEGYVSSIGIFILWRAKNPLVNEANFNEWLSQKPDVPNDHIPLLRKFLYKDFEFSTCGNDLKLEGKNARTQTE